MNREKAEIVLAALDERHRVISPHYAELMGKFGELAINNVTLENLRQNSETCEANEKLLKAFGGLLPAPIYLSASADNQEHTFFVDTAQEARSIQSAIVWIRFPLQKKESRLAYYILGQKPIEPLKPRDPNLSLLLITSEYHGMDNKYASLYLANTWASEARSFENKANENLNSSFSAEQILGMYTQGSKTLALGYCEPDSIGLLTGSKRYPRNRQFYHRDVPIDELEKLDTLAFTDDFLIEYDVLDRLGELATIFGKMINLKSIIGSSTVETDDPMDKLLEPGN